MEFRQRSLAEVLGLLSKNKWRILLPAIAVAVSIIWVVKDLPNMYESKTLLSLSPPAISEKVAPSLRDDDMSKRLDAIQQRVTSRTSMEPMLNKYRLYTNYDGRTPSIDQRIAEFKRHVIIETEKADNQEVVGFSIGFEYSDPLIAQQVTADFADKFVTAEKSQSKESAEVTRQFIDRQLTESREKLDKLESERLEIMKRNVEALPESAQGLIAQLEGLRQREQTLSKDKETLIGEKGRVQDSIRALNSQIRLIQDFGEKETQSAVTQATRIEDTPAYGQLIQRRAQFRAALENLNKQYREKHPDVIKTEIEIAKINDEIEQLRKTTERRARDATLASSRKAELQMKGLEIEKTKAEGQLSQLERQIEAKDRELGENAVAISSMEGKINLIPGVKVALEGVDNEYKSAKTNYDELLKKYNDAQQQVQRENNAQGETIAVVDPANLPESPKNATKKPFLFGMGAAAGLAFGLFFAGIFEVPRLFRVQNIDDAEYFTGLPVLASVPRLYSNEQLLRKRRLAYLKFALGVIVCAGSVPLAVFLLETSRILERLI